MSRITGILNICVICIFLSACGSENASYFPDSAGFRWEYNIEKTTMAGNELQKYVVSNLPSRNVDGETLHVQQSLTGTQILYKNSDAGISRIGYLIREGAERKRVNDNMLIFPANHDLNSTWEGVATTELLYMRHPEAVNMSLKATIPVKSKIVALDEKVKIAAGVFENCIRISTSGSEFTSSNDYIGRTLVEIKIDRWFAPGVGLVKSVTEETTTSSALDKGKMVMELVSYTAG